MSPHDEAEVERFVRYPDTLSPARRDAIAHLIDTDPVARRIADFYREFDDELQAARRSSSCGETAPGPPADRSTTSGSATGGPLSA